MRAHGATHPGMSRSSNEDQFVLATLTGALCVSQSSSGSGRIRCCESKGHLLIVADGMGGKGRGEAASRLTVTSLQAEALRSLAWLLQDLFVIDELKSAVRHVEQVLSRTPGDASAASPVGATVTMGYVVGDTLYLAHVGQGRCYLWRAGALLQLTRDHTVHKQQPGAVAALRGEGATPSSRRSFVTNAIGAGLPGVSVEVHEVPLRPGDLVLMCTDGLTEMVSEKQISATLAADSEPARLSSRLIETANEAGGLDNVTVVVARFEELDTRAR
jgi:protein phosphatase